MNHAVKGGLILGVAIGIVNLLSGVTGLYKNTAMGFLTIVIFLALQGTIIFLTFKKTAAEGKGYGGQLGIGMLVSFIGWLVTVPVTILFSKVIAPEYRDFVMEQQREQFLAQGMPEEQMEAAMKFVEAMASTGGQIVMGLVMALLAGLILSLIIAAFVRHKEE